MRKLIDFLSRGALATPKFAKKRRVGNKTSSDHDARKSRKTPDDRLVIVVRDDVSVIDNRVYEKADCVLKSIKARMSPIKIGFQSCVNCYGRKRKVIENIGKAFEFGDIRPSEACFEADGNRQGFFENSRKKAFEFIGRTQKTAPIP